MATRPPRRPYGRQPPKEPSPPKEDPAKIMGDLQDLTINQGQKIEYIVKVNGTKPITVSWYRNGSTKLKSSKNSKIVFTAGDAKLIIMEANAEDDGEYKLEVTNKFGTDSKTARINVILPEKLKGTIKQKDRKSVDGESIELKGFDKKRGSSMMFEAPPLKKASPRGSLAPRASLVSAGAGGKAGHAGGGAGPGDIPCIVVDGGTSPAGSRRGSGYDPELLKKRGSKMPDDDDETKYFQTKPQNQVVKLGETMFVDCTFKLKPPSVNWYRGAISSKTDPRATTTYDPVKLYSSMQLTKCKLSDEAKFKCQVESENGDETLEFAGFSVFVKDPNDSGLDFRSLLKHKDLKKKRGSKNDPNWGQLSPFEKEQQEKGRNRRMSTIDLSRKTTDQEGKERVASHWIDELEDVTCQDKETKVELACKFSKPTAKVRWYKNKLEIFQGTKYTMVSNDGVFRLTFAKVNKDDASRYICSADLKETSCYLTIESKKDEYFFTQKLLKSTNVKRKKDLSLECMLNDPRPQVSWTKNGEKLEYTPDKYEISRRENRCILRIKNASKEDAAEFGCSVEGDKTAGKVVVEEPEYDFEKNLTDADAYEKESTEFECEVNDEEAPVEWYREEKKIDVNDPKYFTIENGKKRVLRVNNVGSRDEGLYTCKIKSATGKATSAKLYVAPDVIIKEQLKNQKKIEGEDATFTCKVKNPKNYPVKWFRNGEEITPGDKYEIKEEEGGKMTLVVKDLKLDDGAEFTCKIGDRSTSAKLHVDVANKPPTVDLDAIPREITVKAGQDVSIEIPYTGHPKPNAAWSKNKGKLDDQVITSQTANMCKINLKKVKRSNAGDYEVELKNKAGKINVPITLKVIAKPSKPQGPLDVMDIYKDRCRISWKPPKDDGGLPIEGYIVEAQDVATGKWTELGKIADDTQCGVPGLEPGKRYKFRVKAVNALGESEPLVSDSETIAKDPFDPPGQPGKPVVTDYDKDMAEIKWTPPTSDGGSPIQKYVIEKKEKGGNWEKVGMVPPEETSAEIPNLEEGKEYEFRVTPVNEAGPGTASHPSNPVKTKNRKVKPRIDRKSFEEIYTYKAGQEFNVEVKFIGEPPPTPSWTRDKKPMEKVDDVKVLNDEFMTNLKWRNLSRKDTGIIEITVKNQYGSDTAKIELVVFGHPSKPEGPLEVTDVQKDSATVKWSPPKDDGGKPITGYKLEKLNPTTGKWEPLHGTIPANTTEFKIPKLKEGEDYKFRVKAENELGVSEPLETDEAVTIKNPFKPTDPPGKPFVVDSDKNFIKIKWDPPKKDGGAPVTGYNVERKDPKSGKWVKVNDDPLKTPEFTDAKVHANKGYQYRVTAENDGGESKPSDPSEVIKARPLKEAPKLDLSLFAGKEIKVRAGEPIKIEVPIKGTPSPLITWSKGNKELSPSERVKQSMAEDPITGDDKAIFHIPSSVRADSGKLTIKAKNEHGEDSGEIKVIVLDKPTAPKDVDVQDVFADKCTLTWKPPEDDGGAEITGYTVEKYEEDSGVWLPVSDGVAGTSHVVKGLKKGKKYKFRVRAENRYGVSDPTENANFILAKNPYDRPDAPGKPEVVDSDRDFIKIKWDPPAKDGGSPITGYKVERRDPKTGTWKKINTEPLKTPEFMDKKVTAMKEYEYRVTAENAGGESDPSQNSKPIKAKKLKAPPKLDLSGLVGKEVRVRAGEPLKLDIPIDGSPTPTVTWKKDGKELLPNDRILQVNGEEEADLHIPVSKRSDKGKYEIVVSNPYGEESGTINVIVLDKPSPPENLQVSDVFAEHCKLSWQPPEDDGGAEILGYQVEKCEEGSKIWTKVPGSPTDPHHEVNGLEEGKKYKFRVKAENQYGFSDPVETDRFILAKNPYEKPGEPKNVEIDKFDKGSVTLKWKAPTDDGGNPIKGYTIEKCPAKGRGDWSPVNSSPVSGTSFTVPNLVEDSEWEFRVVAVNDAGPGKPSKSTGPHKVRDPVFGAGAPGTPVAEEVTPNSITLAWDKPLDDGGAPIDGYIVEMKDENGDWVEVSPVVKDPKYKVGHLKEGQAYQFRVKAVNEAGAGTPSAPTAPITAEKPAEKPSMDLSKLDEITVRAGETLKIEVPIKGWPLPTASWELDGTPLDIGGRAECEVLEDRVILTVRDVSKKDTGPYNLKLKNASGSVEGTINVKVLDKPAPPEGPLEPTKTTPEEITLEWRPPKDDGGGKIQKYVLEKKKKGSKNWSKCPGSIGPHDTEATAKNLEPGEEYEFRVKAVNEFGESEPLVTTEPIVAKYPFDKPGKPGAPEGIDTTEDSITLSWDPPLKDGGKPIKGYILEKREAGSKRWTRACPHEIDDTEFTVKNLIEGKPYEFRVAAVNDAGVGEFAECDKPIKPQAPATAPKINFDGLNTNINANVGEPFKIKVPFKGGPLPTVQFFNGDKEIFPDDRFKIEVVDGEAILTCRDARKEDQGQYRVVLKNPKGSDSADFNVKVNDKPAAPEGPLKASKVTPESCKLSWEPPMSDGGKPVTHYVIEKKPKGSDKWESVSRYCKGTSCDVSDLEPGEKYEFRVMAVNELGQSEPLVTDKPIIAKYPFDPPGKPGIPKVEDVDEDSVTLSWSKPLEDGGDRVSGYVVEVKEKGSGKWKPVNERHPCRDNKFTVEGLDTGKDYEFRVRGKNLAGLGEPSNPSAAVTTSPRASKASPPGIPTVDKVSKNSVDLSWTPPRSDGGSPLRGYQVERRTPGGSWEKVNHIPIDSTNIHIPDLDEGREYEFRVAAVSGVGVGDYSLGTAPVKVCERKAAKLPEFVQKPRDSTTPFDEDAKFEVVVDGEPMPTVKWFKDGFELKPSPKYRIKEDDDGKVQLIVKGVTAEDAGDITCELSNEKGKETATARLVVQTPPKVDNDFRDQFVDKGDTLRLKIPYKGTGPFSFRLKRDNKDIPEDHSRIKIIEHDDYVILQIKDAEKDDVGKYKLEISNDSGSGFCDIPIKVRAPPGICGRPLDVGDITKNSCHLKWKAPEDDGGARVTHYNIERREVGKSYWTTVSSHTRDLECDVQGLSENKEYLFRVCACNAHGPGEWLEADSPIVAKMPFDPPGPPGEPEAQEVGGDFVSLSWERPKNDGGGRLLGYFIEKKEANSDNWSRINMVPNPGNVFNVPNLIEDREYDFRVFAVNEAGESKPTETSRRVKVTDPKAAKVPEILEGLKPLTVAQGKIARFHATITGQPKVDIQWFKGSRELQEGPKYDMVKEGDTYTLEVKNAFGEDADEYCVKASTSAGSRSSRADLTIKSAPKINVPPRFAETAQFEKGEQAVIKLPFTGNPKPTGKWYKDGNEITDGSKYTIELRERHAILTIRNAERSDDGGYRLSLDNDLGSDSAVVNVAVNDAPDAPRLLQIDNVYHESAMLSWKPPLSDGGGFITQYIVEKQEEGMSNWIRCAPTRFAYANIEGLSPSKNYKFRVIAENLYGRSKPCDSIDLKTVSEHEGKHKLGLVPDDERKKKYTGPKPDNYDRLYRNLWENNYKPLPVDVKSTSVYDNYEICEEIGSGAFGKVHRAVERSSGNNYIVKFVNTPLPADKHTVKNEINVMNDLHHPNLMVLHDAYEEPKEMALVYEYLPGGELFDSLSDGDGAKESDIIEYVRKLCNGIQYMHDKNICHLDLRPECLLSPTKNSRDLKLIDFSLSSRLDPDNPVKVTTRSPEYAAPEILDHDPVGFYSDMWSIGVLAYSLLSGISPFKGATDNDAIEKVRKGDWSFDSDAFKGISGDAKDFISKLMIKNPTKRMSIHEALDHPWLKVPHPDYSYRIPSSRYHPIRDYIRGRYSNWSVPMPTIGRIANYSSLAGQRPRENLIYDAHFDRREAMPRFVIRPHNVSAKEGGVASFKAKVMAGSPPVITWYYKGQALNPSIKFMPKYSGSDYELRISRCKPEDRGSYVVKAVNSYGSREESASLTVDAAAPAPIQRSYSVQPMTKKHEFPEVPKFQEEQKPPKILFPLRDRFLQQGVNFKLIATVESNPIAKARWYKDGKEVFSGGHFKVDSIVGVFTLECPSCDPSDQGKYQCVAENKLGTDETECKININSKVNLAPLVNGGFTRDSGDVLSGSHRYSSYQNDHRHQNGFDSHFSHSGYQDRSRRSGSHVHTTSDTNIKVKVNLMDGDASFSRRPPSRSTYTAPRSNWSSGTTGGYSSNNRTSVSVTSGPSPYTSVARKSTYGSSSSPSSDFGGARSFKRSISHSTHRRF